MSILCFVLVTLFIWNCPWFMSNPHEPGAILKCKLPLVPTDLFQGLVMYMYPYSAGAGSLQFSKRVIISVLLSHIEWSVKLINIVEQQSNTWMWTVFKTYSVPSVLNLFIQCVHHTIGHALVSNTLCGNIVMSLIIVTRKTPGISISWLNHNLPPPSKHMNIIRLCKNEQILMKVV